MVKLYTTDLLTIPSLLIVKGSTVLRGLLVFSRRVVCCMLSFNNVWYAKHQLRPEPAVQWRNAVAVYWNHQWCRQVSCYRYRISQLESVKNLSCLLSDYHSCSMYVLYGAGKYSWSCWGWYALRALIRIITTIATTIIAIIPASNTVIRKEEWSLVVSCACFSLAVWPWFPLDVDTGFPLAVELCFPSIGVTGQATRK